MNKLLIFKNALDFLKKILYTYIRCCKEYSELQSLDMAA